MKIELVSDWRKCKHWLSAQLTMLAMVAQFAYEFSDSLKNFVTEGTFRMITLASLALIFAGRLIKQRERP